MKYVNRWQDSTGRIVKSDTRPGDDFVAMVADGRVRGHMYDPYPRTIGSRAWRESANRRLADRAQYNFENRR